MSGNQSGQVPIVCSVPMIKHSASSSNPPILSPSNTTGSSGSSTSFVVGSSYTSSHSQPQSSHINLPQIRLVQAIPTGADSNAPKIYQIVKTSSELVSVIILKLVTVV